MRAQEFLKESFINGYWNGDRSSFTARLIHETTPEAAENIRLQGFKHNSAGIFFNVTGSGYSGGGYGGVYIICNISGPADGILDLTNDDLPEEVEEIENDSIELARYAKQHGYWAWKDELQFAVLDKRHIQILNITR